MRRDLVVIGASAGGVEALKKLVKRLPPDLSASVLVVLHLSAASPSVLPQILSRSGALRARSAVRGDPLMPGTILVAPPDRHLLVFRDRVLVTSGPQVHGFRPAIDPSFRTAARWRGKRVIGVVLSGVLDDGTAGMISIAARRGLTIVQDPHDALYPSMPNAVLERVRVDHVLPASEIGAAIVAATTTEGSTTSDRPTFADAAQEHDPS